MGIVKKTQRHYRTLPKGRTPEDSYSSPERIENIVLLELMVLFMCVLGGTGRTKEHYLNIY